MDKTEVIKVLEAERKELLSKLQSLELTILTLQQSLNMPYQPSTTLNGNSRPQPVNNSIPDKYKNYHKLNTRQKAATILRNEGKFLHMRQIVKIAQELAPNEDPKTIEKSIKTALYTMKNAEGSSLVNFQVDGMNTNTFWGSKNWLNEDGTVKEKYMYDKDQVSQKKQGIEI